MFQFTGYLSIKMDDWLLSSRVPPFGHPCIIASLTASHGFSQSGASFFSKEWQGILRTPFLAWSSSPSFCCCLCLFWVQFQQRAFFEIFSSCKNCFSDLTVSVTFLSNFSSDLLLCLFFLLMLVFQRSIFFLLLEDRSSKTPQTNCLSCFTAQYSLFSIFSQTQISSFQIHSFSTVLSCTFSLERRWSIPTFP